MADRVPWRDDIVMSGGMTTDNDVTHKRWTDQENLVPPPGKGMGLKPRRGIEPVTQLSSPETEGAEIFVIQLDDITRTKMIAVRDADTRKIFCLGEHANQAGKAPQQPYTGGLDPDDPNGQETGPGFGDDPPPDTQGMTPPYFYLGSSYYQAEGGVTLTITVYRAGSTASDATVNYVSSNGTGEAGTDYTAVSGTLTFAAGDTEKTFTVTIAGSGLLIDKTFFINLFDPSDGHYLARPDRATVHIGGNAFVQYRDQSAELATRTALVLRHNFADNRAYMHYLNLSAPESAGIYVMAEASGSLIVRSYDGDTLTEYIDVFSIETILAEGPAYAATTDPALAVKHDPFLSTSFVYGDTDYDIVSPSVPLINRSGIMYIVTFIPGANTELTIRKLDCRTGAFGTPASVILPIQSESEFGPSTINVLVDANGDFLILAQDRGSVPFSYHFFRVNPSTQQITASHSLDDTDTYSVLLSGLTEFANGSVAFSFQTVAAANNTYLLAANFGSVGSLPGVTNPAIIGTLEQTSDPNGTVYFTGGGVVGLNKYASSTVTSLLATYGGFAQRVAQTALMAVENDLDRLLLNSTSGATLQTMVQTEFYDAQDYDSEVDAFFSQPIVPCRNMRSWFSLNFCGKRENP